MKKYHCNSIKAQTGSNGDRGRTFISKSNIQKKYVNVVFQDTQLES